MLSLAFLTLPTIFLAVPLREKALHSAHFFWLSKEVECVCIKQTKNQNKTLKVSRWDTGSTATEAGGEGSKKPAPLPVTHEAVCRLQSLEAAWTVQMERLINGPLKCIVGKRTAANEELPKGAQGPSSRTRASG